MGGKRASFFITLTNTKPLVTTLNITDKIHPTTIIKPLSAWGKCMWVCLTNKQTR